MAYGRQLQLALLGSSALFFCVASAGSGVAGGFGVREQSAEYQGMSFAGAAAAGGGLSGMFWNPAVAAYAPAGIYTESHYAGVLANSEISGNASVGGVSLGMPQNSGDIAKDALVGASYVSWRISERLVAALSFNSPFGLVTEPSNRFWAGQTFARTSNIKTYNAAPTLAYMLTPSLSIGVGLQVEHMTGKLKSASDPGATAPNVIVQGDDTAFGFTAGINWSPSPITHIGLGYRSSIDHTLEGTVTGGRLPSPPFAANTPVPGGSIKAGVTLPEIVTLSARHQVTNRFTMLGSVEWTNWSRLERLDIVCANNTAPGPVGFCSAGNGKIVNSLALGWHDGWMFSLGGEYQYSEQLKLRAGVAYEISPIQNATERSLRVPDADRIWTSVGATYKWNDRMSFDLAYTHIFVDDGAIDRTENGVRFVGKSETSIDIVAASFKMKFGDVTTYEPLK